MPSLFGKRVPLTADTAFANISFSPDDNMLVINTNEVIVYYHGAATADQPAPATPTEIATDEAELTTASLGAPANRYLLFVNSDKNTDGEVEITLT